MKGDKYSLIAVFGFSAIVLALAFLLGKIFAR